MTCSSWLARSRCRLRGVWPRSVRASRATADPDTPPITALAIVLATRPEEMTARFNASTPSVQCIEAELDCIELPVVVQAALS